MMQAIRRRGRIAALALVWLLLPGLHLFADPLHDAYWEATVGHWHGQSTYLDGALDYRIRDYHSLVSIRIDGDRYFEREIKFYPADVARQIGGALVRDGEGLEVVAEQEGVLAAGSASVLITRQTAPTAIEGTATSIIAVAADTAVIRVVVPGQDADPYRTLITMPTPGTRHRITLGLVDSQAKSAAAGPAPGELRGFSIFRETRVSAAELDQLRADYRQRYKIGAVMAPDGDGANVISRLD